MKLLIVFAFIAAASAVPHQRFLPSEISEIIGAIKKPSTQPDLAAILQKLLRLLLGGHGISDVAVGPALIDQPALIDTNPALIDDHEAISVGPALVHPPSMIDINPALVEEHDDISVGPALVEEHEDISVGPALVEEHEDISVGPALVEEHEDISVGPALVEDQPANPPFNYKGPLVQVVVNVESSAGDVSVDQIYNPDHPAIIPSPVDIIDGSKPELIPDNVDIVENPKPELEVENINIGTPLIPDTAANLPEDLN